MTEDLNFTCKHISDVTFYRGETILSISSMSGRSGLLREGSAHISCLDESGHEIVLELLSEGDTFGESFIYAMPGMDYVVTADSECRVSFINAKTVLSGCNDGCGCHAELLRILLLLSARHAKSQNAYITILSRHTIREKLMTAFRYFSEGQITDGEFTLPMTYSNLADFLCVDRSAMMRELKKMNNEGLIITSGRTISFP